MLARENVIVETRRQDKHLSAGLASLPATRTRANDATEVTAAAR
jgi:hypothetical protein